MIKIVKVPIKPSKQQIEDQKISSQFHYIKELSLMKYDAEEKREHMASMITFYLSVASIIISFAIAIILML